MEKPNPLTNWTTIDLSQGPDFSIREPFCKNIDWRKINIGDKTDKLRYPCLKFRVDTVTQNRPLKLVGNKALCFIDYDLIDGYHL